MLIGIFQTGFDFNLEYTIEGNIKSINFVKKDNTNLQKTTAITSANPVEKDIHLTLNEFFTHYFAGELKSNYEFIEKMGIDNILDELYPPFSRAVLSHVAKIPFGVVETYEDVATAIGSKAIRAVGTTLSKNRFPVIIPCHRVVPKSSYENIKEILKNQKGIERLPLLVGGFMGETQKDAWGTTIKAQLLTFEAKNPL
jgi:O-6-methylguanine DNA methyltransferase